MADPIRDSAYWKKRGEELVRDSQSAGLPPVKQSEYFVNPDADTARVGNVTVPMPRPAQDGLSDAQGHLTGSAMSQMMQKNYDAADESQRKQKLQMYYKRVGEK